MKSLDNSNGIQYYGGNDPAKMGGRFKKGGGGGGGGKSFASDSELAHAVVKAIKATGNYGNVWEKNGMTRVYVKGSGGAGGFIEVKNRELEFKLTGYGQSGVIGNAARSVTAK
jgi:hypothetical protein